MFRKNRLGILFLCTLGPLLALLLMGGRSTAAAPSANPDLGYGFNVAAWNTDQLQAMGFNWMKVFNTPGSTQPVKVLIRLNADATHLGNLEGFRATVREAAVNSGAYIDAYEIGNEVNLDASYGWTAAPIAADYTQLLCAAYEEIKAADPTAVVVSAGLAPTGRVTGNWNGHPGHNGLFQDEREFLKEMITAGAGACLDAVGYHNYGFSANYDTPPDVNGGTADTNCVNGFCFRGVEKIYEIMQDNGMADKQVWTTEFGWITNPSEEGQAACLDDASWQGRLWQIVSQEEQADNLVGAFTYAAENWPWMGAMFVFNLNFNQADYYPVCEQMRFYSVAGRPAEAALSAMPKAYENIPPNLVANGAYYLNILQLDSAPAVTRTYGYSLSNTGGAPLTYTVSISSGMAVTPTLMGTTTAVLSPTETATFTATISSVGYSLGSYTGTMTIAVDPAQAGFPRTIPVHITLASQIYAVHLPAVMRP